MKNHQEERRWRFNNGGRRQKRETVLSEAHIRTVQELLTSLKFGSITLVAQDGKIIQIEKHEK